MGGLWVVPFIFISHRQLTVQPSALLSTQTAVKSLAKPHFKQDINCTSISCATLTFWEFEGQEPCPGCLM